MSTSPRFTTFLTARGWQTSQSLVTPSHSNTPIARRRNDVHELLAVGVVLDDDTVAWGDCVSGDLGFTISEGARLLREVVAPSLTQQAGADFRRLSTLLGELTYEATITRKRPFSPSAQDKLSRRDLFTGQLDPTVRQSATETVIEKRPLPTALRFGISQALLRGVAHRQNRSVADVVCNLYQLPLPSTPAPLQIMLAAGESDGATTALALPVAALGLIVAQGDTGQLLGTHGEKLQRFIREFQAWLAAETADSFQPVIHLDMRGALGKLYENQSGAMLGALFGLERVAQPYRLRIVDPVLHVEPAVQQEKLRELKQLVDMRKMSVQIAARHHMTSRDAVEDFLTGEAVDAVHLEPSRIGSWAEVIGAVLVGKATETAVVLGDTFSGTNDALQVTAQVALATQPDVVVAATTHDVTELHNEMLKTLRSRPPLR